MCSALHSPAQARQAMARILLLVLALTLLVTIISGCKKADTATPDTTAPADFPISDRGVFPGGTAATEAKLTDAEKTAVSKQSMAKPTDEEVKAAKAAGTRYAIIKTSKGDINVELYGTDAPLTVANFVKLATANYYDGLTFHRVETNPEFRLIQGGDPMGNGSGGPGYQIKLEISPKLRHVEGALAMARSQDLDSAGCQFYIGLMPLKMLDDQYAVFGKVTAGLDVAKKIAVGDRIISIRMK